MARILVVRHAQSEWNAMGRWQGWADPPLTTLGRSQAERAGRHLLAEGPAVSKVVSSDLQRASQTARILAGIAAPSAILSEDPDWREYRVGAWSGLNREQIEQRWPGDLGRWDRGDLTTPPDGEPREKFEARLLEALDRTAATTTDGATTLVVSHGGAVRSFGRRLNAPFDHVANLAGIHLEGTAGRYRRVGSVNLLPRADGRRAQA